MDRGDFTSRPTRRQLHDQLAVGPGYVVIRDLIDEDLRERALRRLIEELVPARDGEQWGDAQLVLRFPDEAEDWPLTPHVDHLPEWAGTRSYEMIFGVALSRARASDGCLTVWGGSHRGEGGALKLVELAPGDVVVLHPNVGHSSTLNRGGQIRYAVYFRLLGAPA
jgi:hypothetical protein